MIWERREQDVLEGAQGLRYTLMLFIFKSLKKTTKKGYDLNI
jgi:hypothetical protein